MSGKRAIEYPSDEHHVPKLIKLEGIEDEEKKPVIPVMEWVRHVFFAEGNTKNSESASCNTKKDLLGDIFCKMVVCQKDSKPIWDGSFRSTTPSGRCGCNHKTTWIDGHGFNRVDVRFWGNPNRYTVKLELTMWTNAPPDEMVLLRTLIKTDGTQEATRDTGFVYQKYFTPTVDELQQNNNMTKFMFKLDITMHSK
jgi:hypothetical protein